MAKRHYVSKVNFAERSIGTGSAATLPASIYAHGQSTLPDGRVLVTHGINAYMYIPNTNIWTEVASIPASFAFHGQSTLLDGDVLVSGGWNGSIRSNTVYIYNPNDTGLGSWTMATPLPIGFDHHGQSTLVDGKVIVSGGLTDSGAINDTHIYTPSSNIWITASPVPLKVRDHAQSTLLNGEVLVSGGYIDIKNSYTYNQYTDIWASASPMPVGFHYHRQSTLADGKVLISGGSGTSGILKDAYIYTPNGTWSPVNPMPTALNVHGQSTLADGRVLISGGNDGTGTINTAYIYTPAGWMARIYFCNAITENNILCKQRI